METYYNLMTKIIMVLSAAVMIILLDLYSSYQSYIPQKYHRTCRLMFICCALICWNQMWLLFIPHDRNPLVKLSSLVMCVTVLSFLYDIKRLSITKQKRKKMSVQSSFLLKSLDDQIIAINETALPVPITARDYPDEDPNFYIEPDPLGDELCIDVATENQLETITLDVQHFGDEGTYRVSNIPWVVVEFVGPRPPHRPH